MATVNVFSLTPVDLKLFIVKKERIVTKHVHAKTHGQLCFFFSKLWPKRTIQIK